jgi:hypothetical protein
MRALRCNSKFALEEKEVYENNKYDFKVQVIQNIVYVYSIMDLWIIQKVGDKKFHLYHQNKKFDKDTYHFHEVFDSLCSAFKYINNHDSYVLKSKWSLPPKLRNAYRKARGRK